MPALSLSPLTSRACRLVRVPAQDSLAPDGGMDCHLTVLDTEPVEFASVLGLRAERVAMCMPGQPRCLCADDAMERLWPHMAAKPGVISTS